MMNQQRGRLSCAYKQSTQENNVRKLTIQKTALYIVFAMLFAMALRIPVDTDLWWHVRSGQYTVTDGMIYSDPFSHTYNGTPWTNYSWASQLVMYGMWSLAGDAGLALFTALLALGGMWFLYRCSEGNIYLRGCLLILGAATAAIFWSARPQMFSFFFSTVLLWLMFRYKRQRIDRLWWIVPLMWVWSHFHAGWSIGYLFLFAFIVGEALNNLSGNNESIIGWAGWRKLVLVTVISIPVLLISPYTFNNLLVPVNTVSIDSLRSFIQEWNSPAFQGRETWPFIGLVMLLFLVLWASRLSIDWSAYFLLIGTMFLALLYARNIAVFAVVAVPILSFHAHSILEAKGWILRERETVNSRMALINTTLLVLVIAGVAIYVIGMLLPANIEKAQEEVLPIHAVAYLREHDLPRPMFNSYNWGGYLMFHAPEYEVFIDGRTDIYGDFLFTYRDAAFAYDNWREILDEYGIRLVVIEAGSPLAGVLRTEPGWNLEYSDELAVIYTR
jgi:hypothetical protein